MFQMYTSKCVMVIEPTRKFIVCMNANAPVQEIGGRHNLGKCRSQAHHRDGDCSDHDGERRRIVRGLAPETRREHTELSHAHDLKGIARHFGLLGFS